MPFSIERFEAQEFRPRTERFAVPALAEFFDPDERAEFEIRGLTAAEVLRAIDASRRVENREALAQALAERSADVETLRRIFGVAGKETPGELAKRIEYLIAGCVSPKINHRVAVKIAEAFPLEFLGVTTAIAELTGKGADLVKRDAASQAIQA